jgi:tyrosine-protein phosphatase YwqE
MPKHFFSFFKSSPKTYFDWGIKLDMHNHLLPALDDGAPDLLSSQRLWSGLQDLGFTQSIFTPHIAATLYENTAERIQTAFDSLKSVLQHSSEGPWSHRFAAEYMLDDLIFQRMEEGLLTFPGASNYVLVEFSYVGMPYNWHEMIFELLRRGYQPILAHPERYSFIHAPFILKKLVPAGLKLQLNLLSLGAYYGPEAKKTADFLLREGAYQFAGTDVHHAHHITALQAMKTDEKISNRLASYSFDNEQLFSA